MMTLRDHLQAIYDARGVLTPELVVQEARDPSHPLHGSFEWDDVVAGEAWRREQAHRLIQKVRIVYREADEHGPEKTVRAFHSVRTDRGYVYEPVENVVADDFTRKLVLQNMRREWIALRRKYQDFEEFLSMVRGDVNDNEAGAA